MLQTNKTGNTKIRSDHKKEILNYIRRIGTASRTEIFEQTHISKPTVTRVIEELLKDGLILETGSSEASIGRKPVNLELNADAYFCIGVNISKNSIYASIVNFKMNVILSKSVSIKGVEDAPKFLNYVVRIIEECIQESGIKREKILGIGIGAPGIVDFNEGVILDFAVAHCLLDIHIGEHLQSKLGLKVFVDNNANTRALGEYWYGFGTGYENIIFVICSEGVGSGIIAGGSLVRSNNAGLNGLGHMTVNLRDRNSDLNKLGCIEEYCSTEAIENITKAEIKNEEKSEWLEKQCKNIEELDYHMICKGAQDKDELCCARLREAANVLSTGLINLISIFNPDMIILSGTMFDASEFFYTTVIDYTKNRLFSPLHKEILYRKRSGRDSLYEIGAATMVFKQFFND